MGEVVPFSENNSSPQKGGELLQDVETKISAGQAMERFKVERVMIWGKILPFLLKAEDFSKMVKENEYDRDPTSFENQELKPLLKRVENIKPANDNNTPLAQVA